MIFRTLLLILFSSAILQTSLAAETVRKVKVADPFLEMHTGASSGYPIFHVVERGEIIEVLKRHTNWFLIKNYKNKEGWVHSSQLSKTLTLKGEQVKIKEITRENYLDHGHEVGMIGGEFAGLTAMTFYYGYSFTQNLTTEVAFSQVIGDFSSRNLLTLNLVNQPFPEWKIAPYFTIGTGIIERSVNSRLSKLKDTTDSTANVGVGIKTYLTRSFILRVDFKKHIIFLSKDKNEETTSWQAGFSFFF